MKLISGVKSSNVPVATSGKEIARKRSLSHQLQQNDDDLATLLRHSADDEDEGDEEVNGDINVATPWTSYPFEGNFLVLIAIKFMAIP